MPTIFCQPVNNLGNRLISIIGWYRLSRILGYDFVLVWPTAPDLGCFVSCYSELFEAPFSIVREMPNGTVQIPKITTINARNYVTFLESKSDIYVPNWYHFVYAIEEQNKSSGELTSSLRSYALQLLRPSAKVLDFGAQIGYYGESFDISLHWRGSAWLYNNWTAGSIASLESIASFARTLHQQKGGRSCFISSGTMIDGVELAHMLKSQFDNQIFLSRSQSHEPSFVNHAIAVLDFMNLTRSKDIVNSGVTTFSALAALVGMAILHTPVDEQRVYSRVPLVGTGLGI